MDSSASSSLTDSAEIKIAGAKMACGALLAWCSVYTLNQWVAIVTIAYIVLQIGLLIPKYFRSLIVVYRMICIFFRRLYRKKNGSGIKK